MSCQAKIRPFDNDKEILCEVFDGRHETHKGGLRDYAAPGSFTEITWLDGDRRTFRGEWKPCARLKNCTLPAEHRGDCAL